MNKLLLILFTVTIPIYTFSQNIVSINPSNANAGQTLTVSITGANTSFSQGSGTVIDFEFNQGSSVVNSINIISDTLISANITVPSKTVTGDYDVYAVNSIDGSLTLVDGIHVDGPSLVSINPANANAGQTLTVTITGANTNFSQGSGTVISFQLYQGSATIVVNSSSALSDTTISANITVLSSTPMGDYDVYAVNSIDGSLTLIDGFHVGVTDFESVSINPGILIYPNPANRRIIVEYAATAIKKDKIISIINTQGKTVLQVTSQYQKIEINIGKLPSGLYLLKMESSEGISWAKFIK
ncbi:MAG: T9SS type A sorting domain-containing protein [Bacteroidetes bacterium]|nr:T9SS type A sorting domain-containing protein [Bacteroidota bacterium]